MKKRFLLVTGLLMAWCLQAQVIMTPQLPPLGLTVKPQLWNLSIVNSSGAILTGQLQMVMTDAATNQTVLSGSSPLFMIAGGAKVITANDVSPITYTTGAGYSIDPGPNGFLPVGTYNICYTLTKWTNDISEEIAEECVTAEIEPVSPPQLVMPGDSDLIYTYRPFFTWIPPSPVGMFVNLQYDLVLTEVQAMQTAADAIQQNLPVLTQANITFTSLQYPLSMPQLDTGKVYAWRVTAKNNGMTIANSEVWSFRAEAIPADTFRSGNRGFYSPVQRHKDGSYIICSGVLLYQYTHELNSTTVQLSITDLSSPTHAHVQLDSNNCSVRYGSNYLQLDLSEVTGVVDKHMYLLELVNDRNERWFLKFEYRKPE